MAQEYKVLPCQVRQGAFSGELTFVLPLKAGGEYRSLGPIMDFLGLNHIPLQAPVPAETPALMSIFLVNDQVAVLPDGEAIRLDALEESPVSV